MAFELPKRIVRINKLPAVVTFFFAIIAFALSLVVLLAGGRNGSLDGFDLMMLNTSTLLQSAVKVENLGTISASATATKKARAVEMPRATSPPSVADIKNAHHNNMVERGLLSDASTFFTGLAPTATTGLVASATSIFGGATSAVGSAVNSALGGIENLAAQEVESLINEGVETVLTALGIEQYYSLYMTEYCSGTWSPNYADPNAVMNVTNCTQYTDADLGFSPSNSTVDIGQVRLDFSALNFPNKLSGTGGQLTAIFTLIKALQIIGVASTAILILVCPLSIALPIFNGSMVRFAIASLAGIAALSITIDAAVLSLLPIIVGSILNKLVGDLGAQAHVGVKFIVMSVISAVLMITAFILWAVHSFDATFMLRSHAGDKIIEAPSRMKIGNPVVVKSPQETYVVRQETGTVMSV